MFAKLTEFRTINGQEAETAKMAAYLADQLRAAGFEQSDIEIVKTGEKTGLIARYRGVSGSGKKPVLFLGHMDVVDARRDEWKSDPWVLTERDGALYGRGTVDNKYGILTIAQAFMRLKREGFLPDRDLIIAFSGDEESGMTTTRALAERLNGAAYAINSDAGGGYRGTNGEVSYAYQAAEKTYATFELTARNKGGHSSRPRADNAIYDLARALEQISKLKFPSRWNDITIESFRALEPSLPSDLKPLVAKFAAAPSADTAKALIAKEPSFEGDVQTTCVATMLRGGIVENALPTEATATVNCRIFPGETVEQTKTALAKAVGKDIAITVLGEPTESPVSHLAPDARAALQAVLDVRAPKATLSPYMEAGGTDGKEFRRAGIPTVAIGPLFSTDESKYNFHGIDERLPISEFDSGLDHYYLFIKALAGRGK